MPLQELKKIDLPTLGLPTKTILRLPGASQTTAAQQE
jgi:hypothetical protein